MRNINKLALPAVLAVGVVGGLELGHNNTDHNPVAPNAQAAGLTPEAEAAADCNVKTYSAEDYKAQVGANLVARIGNAASNGQIEFASKDQNETSHAVAKALAPNDAASAVVYTILGAESGITPSQVTEQATQTLSQMEADKKRRDDICKVVLTRVLKTPNQYSYQSPTGKIAIHAPSYDASGNFDTIADTVTPNTSAIEAFSIAPVAGSSNEARDKGISENWGITADGVVFETAHKEGTAHVTHKGKPVSIKQHGKTPVGSAKHNHIQGGGAAHEQQQSTSHAGNGGGGGSTHHTGKGVTGVSHNGRGPGKGVSQGRTPERTSGPAAGHKKGAPSSIGKQPESTSGHHQSPGPGGPGGPGPQRQTPETSTQTNTQTSTTPAETHTTPTQTTPTETQTTPTQTTQTQPTKPPKTSCDPAIDSGC